MINQWILLEYNKFLDSYNQSIKNLSMLSDQTEYLMVK